MPWNDILIVTLGLEKGCRVFAADQHFEAMAKVLPILLYQPVTTADTTRVKRFGSAAVFSDEQGAPCRYPVHREFFMHEARDV